MIVSLFDIHGVVIRLGCMERVQRMLHKGGELTQNVTVNGGKIMANKNLLHTAIN
jgi:hypothetical protein